MIRWFDELTRARVMDLAREHMVELQGENISDVTRAKKH